MRILGLTGSIGMGKSVASALFRRRGIPVHDADQAVHRALGRGGAAVAAVGRAFPGVVSHGAVDRRRLGALVFGKPEALRRLEAILHPLARQSSRRFLAAAARRRAAVVVLDVPLLFETGGDRRCDATVVVSAPAFLQRQRVLRRPGMTAGKFDQILKHQMPDREKRRRADYVALSGLGRATTGRTLARILAKVRQRRARAWQPGYGRKGRP